MKKIENMKDVRLEEARKRCNELARYTIEDLVDEDNIFNILDYDIKLFRQWIRIFNNMRIMRGLNKVEGFYYYWHCLD